MVVVTKRDLKNSASFQTKISEITDSISVIRRTKNSVTKYDSAFSARV